MGLAKRSGSIAAGAVLVAVILWGAGRMPGDAEPGGASSAQPVPSAVSPAAAANTVILDGVKDNGRTVQLAAGALLNIDLASNATTGFQWSLVDPLPSCLELIVNRYVSPSKAPDAKGDLVGAPGRQIFELKAVRPGTGRLRFEYRRPWEKDAAATQVFQVTVRVE